MDTPQQTTSSPMLIEISLIYNVYDYYGLGIATCGLDQKCASNLHRLLEPDSREQECNPLSPRQEYDVETGEAMGTWSAKSERKAHTRPSSSYPGCILNTAPLSPLALSTGRSKYVKKGSMNPRLSPPLDDG